MAEENAARVTRLAGRFIKRVGGESGNPLTGKTVADLGLSFKPNIDDMCEAKSIELYGLLRKAGAYFRAYAAAVSSLTGENLFS